MNISKFKLIWTAMTGGVTGVIEYLLDIFNKQILSRIHIDKAALYAGSVKAVADCLNNIFNLWAGKIGEEKAKAFVATIEAVSALAKALEDANVSEDELDLVIAQVKEAVEAWKAVK